MKLVRFPHKALIFAEDSVSNCIYLVFTGRIVLTKKTPGGAQQVIAYKGRTIISGNSGCSTARPAAPPPPPTARCNWGASPGSRFSSCFRSPPGTPCSGFSATVSENLRATNARYVGEVVRKEKITLIGEMANTMIHDFRGPFSTIKLVTELLAKRHGDPKTQELCATILRQVTRLGGMVEEVLEFARGETRLHLKDRPADRGLRAAAGEHVVALGRAGVKLHLKPTTLELSLDSDRFLRVLQNLVTNAREALSNRPNSRITISARRLQTQCVITWRTTGRASPRTSGPPSSSRSSATARPAAPASASPSPAPSSRPTTARSITRPRAPAPLSRSKYAAGAVGRARYP